jgi:hypothetical protein
MTVSSLSRRQFPVGATAVAILLRATQDAILDIDKVRARYHEAEQRLRALVVRLPCGD